RPWTTVAWCFLTLGICLGSFWAYYELGWGGWWFWDPVENASFMPWLAGTALLHSAIVMEKREALKVWTILLAILTFSLSLLGTFLVRSGVLTSVHAFAVDPKRGTVILLIMALFVGGSLALYALRAGSLRQGGIFAPISREGSLVLNNVLLTTACATVFVGTLYPLLLESLNGAKISVGPPYFNATFIPLMVPLLLALPFGPMLAWKRGDIAGAAQRLYWAMVGAAAVALAAFAIQRRGPWLAPVMLAVGAWVILGAIAEWAERIKLLSAGREEILRRARNLPRAAYGGLLGHIGVGVMTVGIVATSAWQTEVVMAMKPGDRLEVAGFEIEFRGVAPRRGPNYQETFARLNVTAAGRPVTVLESAKRLYDSPRQPTTEAGIHSAWTGDLYVVLGDPLPEGAFAVRAYFHPFVRWIWFGALIMSIGGVISLTDRRLRVGAPRRAAVRAAQPAE
ncbi:MAG: heme lyase CcmF/NrfE family subunit, partial [Hyphomicrobiales bacterium]|nr:heme lyase CcmF/NrfE family subunit [Hyphomicrobiales bacterium]